MFKIQSFVIIYALQNPTKTPPILSYLRYLFRESNN